MLTILATGTLIRDPESRTTAKGKTFATALLRVAVEGDEAALCSIIAFSNTAVDAILAHGKGDTLAIAGRGKLSNWTGKDGTECHGISVTVERVLSAYMLDQQRRKARGEKNDGDEPTPEPQPELQTAQAPRSRTSTASDFSDMEDDIPF